MTTFFYDGSSTQAKNDYEKNSEIKRVLRKFNKDNIIVGAYYAGGTLGGQAIGVCERFLGGDVKWTNL